MRALWPNGKAETRRVGGGFFTATKLALGLFAMTAGGRFVG